MSGGLARISREAFDRLPRKLGWQYQYARGLVHVRPLHTIVVARIETASLLESTTESTDTRPRPVTEGDFSDLVDTFEKAFAGTVEYRGADPGEMRDSARIGLRGFFDGDRGEPLAVSRVLPDNGCIVGAALILRHRNGPLLDLLLVDPSQQRRGVARQLVTTAAKALASRGEKVLFSCYRLANAASLAWHHRIGFADEPDLQLAIIKRDHFAAELQRRLRSGLISSEERNLLEAEHYRWQDEVERLEEVARREGQMAVAPFLRLQQARGHRSSP